MKKKVINERLRILRMVKEGLLSLDCHVGMCSIFIETNEYGMNTHYNKDIAILHKIIKEWVVKTNRKGFYNYDGKRVTDKSQFIFKANDRPIRIKWVNQRIKELNKLTLIP